MRLVGVSKARLYQRGQRCPTGQGVVEYAGALVIAVIVIGLFSINSESYVDMVDDVMTAVGAKLLGEF